MTVVTYEIVEHDGGWAYRVGGTYSETFRSHDAAKAAARRARWRTAGLEATKSASAGKTKRAGHWHNEIADGRDRPENRGGGVGSSRSAGGPKKDPRHPGQAA